MMIFLLFCNSIWILFLFLYIIFLLERLCNGKRVFLYVVVMEGVFLMLMLFDVK